MKVTNYKINEKKWNINYLFDLSIKLVVCIYNYNIKEYVCVYFLKIKSVKWYHWLTSLKEKCIPFCSEKYELFLNISFNSLCFDSENVESHCLWEGSALANSDYVSFSKSLESWGEVYWEVGVSLLKSVILLYIVEIISSYDSSSLHFGR